MYIKNHIIEGPLFTTYFEVSNKRAVQAYFFDKIFQPTSFFTYTNERKTQL